MQPPNLHCPDARTNHAHADRVPDPPPNIGTFTLPYNNRDLFLFLGALAKRVEFFPCADLEANPNDAAFAGAKLSCAVNRGPICNTIKVAQLFSFNIGAVLSSAGTPENGPQQTCITGTKAVADSIAVPNAATVCTPRNNLFLPERGSVHE